MGRRNLIIVHRGPEYEQDFDDIASRVTAMDPEVTVYHLPSGLEVEIPLDAWFHPTLTVALAPDFRVPIRRGPVLKSRPLGKLAQYELFRSLGIASPPAMPFTFGMKLDPIVFGDFVILKPGNWTLSSTGSGINVLHRTTAEQLSTEQVPPGHPLLGRGADYIVQRFIDTGPHPHKYRALTLLGRVLYISHEVNREARPALSKDLHLSLPGRFHTSGTRKTFLPNDGVKAFAESVAGLFPDLPLLGLDILEGSDGRLHVLELNAGGNVWHFSSHMWAERRQQDPTLIGGMKDQYGAFDIAAAALLDKTRALAS